eukprot:216344_1
MTAVFDKYELIAHGYIRENTEIYIPIDIKKLIIEFSMLHVDSDMFTRASEQNFSALRFHECCDGMAPTITFIQTEFGNVFGGYTIIPWTSITQWQTDKEAFLFLLRSNKTDVKCPQTFKVKKPQAAVRHSKNKGPCFGDGCDVNIIDKCNEYCTRYDYGRVSCCYDSSSGNCFSHKGDILCGGNASHHHDMLFFRVVEYEVFQLH